MLIYIFPPRSIVLPKTRAFGAFSTMISVFQTCQRRCKSTAPLPLALGPLAASRHLSAAPRESPCIQLRAAGGARAPARGLGSLRAGPYAAASWASGASPPARPPARQSGRRHFPSRRCYCAEAPPGRCCRRPANEEEGRGHRRQPAQGGRGPSPGAASARAHVREGGSASRSRAGMQDGGGPQPSLQDHRLHPAAPAQPAAGHPAGSGRLLRSPCPREGKGRGGRACRLPRSTLPSCPWAGGSAGPCGARLSYCPLGRSTP